MGAAVPGAGLAAILRRHGPTYLATHDLSVTKAKVWRAIVACRTAALGGHVETCNHCGVTRHVYHSCRNRHRPLCQTRAKEAWLAQRRRELLPVPYFHLVFTLPHDLHGLVGQCPRMIYKMLFGAVAATLTEFAANPRWLGGTPAFSLVLHTWKQDLGRHVHVHALVAGGALTAAGEWTAARRGFLFPVWALSKVFRGKFVTALNAARESGKLHAEQALAAASWRALLARLHAHEWVVYAKQPLGGPAQVLEYLGRYTHRGDLERADRGSGRPRSAVSGARCCRWQAQAPTATAGGNLHRPLSLACLAAGLQAYPPLWVARAGSQGGEAGAGAGGTRGARTRSGGGGVGGGVHAPY